MALKIRLARLGDKGNPFYRIVVADSRSPRDGKFVEILGAHDPKVSDASKATKVDKDLVAAWIAKGAQPTDTVRALLIKAGALKAEKFKPKANAKPAAVKAKKEK